MTDRRPPTHEIMSVREWIESIEPRDSAFSAYSLPYAPPAGHGATGWHYDAPPASTPAEHVENALTRPGFIANELRRYPQKWEIEWRRLTKTKEKKP